MTPMKMLSTKVRQPCFKDGVCSIAQKLHYLSAYNNIIVYKNTTKLECIYVPRDY